MLDQTGAARVWYSFRQELVAEDPRSSFTMM